MYCGESIQNDKKFIRLDSVNGIQIMMKFIHIQIK